MATSDDRSISGGVSIPQWMKSKINDKFDFEQSAFSPTELDDSFMYYYRNPAGGKKNNDLLTTNVQGNNIQVAQDSDFSKHTTPCQKYLQSSNNFGKLVTPDGKVKSNGTDDGFKGEAAKCGSSIIRVANQMVAENVVHGFNIPQDDICDPDLKHFDPHKRRGSRSLPTSPLSSPKGKRKAINKYFTGPYVDADQHKGGWILSNLLARREISQSVGFISEEGKEEVERAMSTLSVDDAGAGSSQKTPTNQVFKAKPSELREMNFWSPTSM